MKMCDTCGWLHLEDDVEECAKCKERLNNVQNKPLPKGISGTYRLMTEQGLVPGKSYIIFDATVMIGRVDEDISCFPEIDLSDQEKLGEYSVSRKHARICIAGNKILIEDMGSMHGTMVDGKPVTAGKSVEIKAGQQLQFGKFVILKLIYESIPHDVTG